jgi:hypothetical protein
MWGYSQTLGQILNPDGTHAGFGYSGSGHGKNNSEFQHVHNVGPIPRGFYEIGEPFDSDTHGPFCLRLTPFPENEMFGRDGFLIHGDSIKAPGMASQGCIILQPGVRHHIAESDDKILEVNR